MSKKNAPEPQSIFDSAAPFFAELGEQAPGIPLSYSYQLYLPELQEFNSPAYLKKAVKKYFLKPLAAQVARGETDSIPAHWHRLGNFQSYQGIVHNELTNLPDVDWVKLSNLSYMMHNFERSAGHTNSLVKVTTKLEDRYSEILGIDNEDAVAYAVEGAYRGANLLAHLPEYDAAIAAIGVLPASAYIELKEFFELLIPVLLLTKSDNKA
jgi:hypothetical protein